MSIMQENEEKAPLKIEGRGVEKAKPIFYIKIVVQSMRIAVQGRMLLKY